MAEQELDRPDIGAGFQEMDRETVTQYMWREGFGETGASVGAMTGLFDSGPSEWVVGSIAGKQPRRGPAQAPPVPQDREQRGREHHVPIALPFALVDAEHHPPTVDIGGAKTDGLGDPESRGVARRQDGVVFRGCHARERARLRRD